MTESAIIAGGCLCGAIRYRVTGTPRLVSNCHCSLCRRSSGAPFVAWLTVRLDQFAVERGALTRFASSVHGWRAFCVGCGTQIASGSSNYPRHVEVSVGSLDSPDRVRPERHVFWPDRLPWASGDDGLPRHVGDARSPLVDNPGVAG